MKRNLKLTDPKSGESATIYDVEDYQFDGGILSAIHENGTWMTMRIPADSLIEWEGKEDD